MTSDIECFSHLRFIVEEKEKLVSSSHPFLTTFLNPLEVEREKLNVSITSEHQETPRLTFS